MSVPLSDEQIERYSRQIVLPEIGGRGQQRLLAATVVLAGTGPLAATAARYLVGAGIGRLRLAAAAFANLGNELQQLNPDVTVSSGDLDIGTTVALAADLPLALLEDLARGARALAVPLIAAGRRIGGGWLHVPAANADCAACALRAIAARYSDEEVPPLEATADTVLGSLLALAALENILELPNDAGSVQWFAVATSLLTPVPWTRATDCRAHSS